MRPLEGITVIALEQAVAAPLASRHLADLGARVIKIERPDTGDFARGYDKTVNGLASFFVWLNRSKESLTLNLKHAEGKAILGKLLQDADVFIHNLAPGAVDRLGFGAATLAERNPRIITCNMSGYGASGPYQNKKAYDLLIQAEAGFLSITGTPDTPSKAGISIADISGGMYAYSGILTSLFTRERTGKGESLDVALFDTLAEWMGYPMYFTGYGGNELSRNGASHPGIAPYGPYPTGDGGTVMLGIQNQREWVKFCMNVLERPELAEDQRFENNTSRVENRAELNQYVINAFQFLTSAQVVDRLESAGIANARANSMKEFMEHPQLSARDRWTEVETSTGPVQALFPPVNFKEIDYTMGTVPDLGDHTVAILHDLQYDDAGIERLRQEGAI